MSYVITTESIQREDPDRTEWKACCSGAYGSRTGFGSGMSEPAAIRKAINNYFHVTDTPLSHRTSPQDWMSGWRVRPAFGVGAAR